MTYPRRLYSSTIPRDVLRRGLPPRKRKPTLTFITLGPVREFDGTDDTVAHSAAGALATMTYGVIAAIFKTDTVTGGHQIYTPHNSSGGFVQAPFMLDGSQLGTFGSPIPANIAIGRWYLAVFRKGLSTASVTRLSLYDYTTGLWSHANSSSTTLTWDAPGSGGFIRQDVLTTLEVWDGKMAVRAVWADSVPWSLDSTGDAAIEAEGMEDSLQAWADNNPTALWPYNQTSTSSPIDDVRGSADQTSLIGSTVVTNDGPSPFNWALTSGQTFNITPAGAITPTGALVKLTSKPFAGAFTPTGLLAKLAGKVLTGSVTPTGALTNLRLVLVALAGAITPSGSLVKGVNKVLSGGFTPAGTLRKQVTKVFAGGVSPVGGLRKLVSKGLGGGVTPSGVLSTVKVVLRSFAGAIAPTGILVKQARKALSGGFTPTGVVRKQVNKALGGVITPVGALRKAVTKLLTGGITPAGVLSTAKVILRSFAGAITPTGALRKQPQKGLTGSIAPAGSIRRNVSIARGGSIAPSGGLRKFVSKLVGGVLASFGTFVGGLPPPPSNPILYASGRHDRRLLAMGAHQTDNLLAIQGSHDRKLVAGGMHLNE